MSPGPGRLPVYVHETPGATDPGVLRPDGPVYLDWFLENASPFPTGPKFESHVYLDGIFVGAWTSTQSPPFQVFGVSDWPNIPSRIRVDPGEHRLKLVVDALDQVPETDETDNVFEWSFTWSGAAAVPVSGGSRTVNLALAPPAGRSEAVVTAAGPGTSRSGPLTVDAPTYVSWGVANNGLASTGEKVVVHTYFDGILVAERAVEGIAARSSAAIHDWDELGRLVRISPGEHEISVIVDPGNLVAESDETDNRRTVTLTWGTGPPELPGPEPEPEPVEPPPFEELTRPNLSAHLPSDWDGPLVIRSAASAGAIAGRMGRVSAFTGASVDFSISNSSPVATGNAFSARLLLDGVIVDRSSFSAGSPGGTWIVDRVIPAQRMTPGTHTLTLEIDADSEVVEADETDNTLSIQFEAVSGPVPAAPPPTTFNDEELAVMLAAIPDVVLATRHADDPDADREWPAVLLSAAEAAYFLATGVALADQRIDIQMLPRAEYEARSLAICLEDQATMTAAEREQELAECRSSIGRAAGLTWSGSGITRVTVDTSGTPARVLTTLLHELGHARQQIVAPFSSTTALGDAAKAVYEAQAQVFEAVAWRHIEDFLGRSYTAYPDLPVLRQLVNGRLDKQVAAAADLEEHGLGYELMWLAALQDPGGLGLAAELRSRGALSASTATDYFDYLLTIAPDQAVAWVNARLAAAGTLLSEYRQIALARLVAGLDAGSEGHPDLLDTAFLSP